MYKHKYIMSETYKTFPGGLYFVTFTTVGWLDIFTRRVYQDILINSLIYCQQDKGLQLYCYCVMPSHVHIIAKRKEGILNDLIRDMKAFTSKKLMDAIEENMLESRREWLIKEFKYYGKISPHKQYRQFWQHNNHAFELYSNRIIDQKINYIHNNPVEAGFVDEPHLWRLSSANENSPVKVLSM